MLFQIKSKLKERVKLHAYEGCRSVVLNFHNELTLGVQSTQNQMHWQMVFYSVLPTQN